MPALGQVFAERAQLVSALVLAEVLLQADAEAGGDVRGGVREIEHDLSFFGDAENAKLRIGLHKFVSRPIFLLFTDLDDLEGVRLQIELHEHQIVTDEFGLFVAGLAMLLLDDVMSQTNEVVLLNQLCLILVSRKADASEAIVDLRGRIVHNDEALLIR
jgi:hypothetical protein